MDCKDCQGRTSVQAGGYMSGPRPCPVVIDLTAQLAAYKQAGEGLAVTAEKLFGSEVCVPDGIVLMTHFRVVAFEAALAAWKALLEIVKG